MNITRVSESEFIFECETADNPDTVRDIKEFEFEDTFYFIKNIVPCIDADGYASFFVSVVTSSSN